MFRERIGREKKEILDLLPWTSAPMILQAHTMGLHNLVDKHIDMPLSCL